MGGRGTYALGKNVAQSYKTIDTICGVKVLEGIGDTKGLPVESHTSNAYIQLHADGKFKMYREYDADHYLIKEIAYHPEPKLAGNHLPILHIHEYNKDDFHNREPRLLTAAEYEKYKKFFKGL
ncbi:MAG TPA: hypothetical protein DD384_02970 [Firmicutes bacterium]|nr:hypothetical protein [Clostridiales bacterium]HBN00184.1 hypothetical protein [Bacillota bacterium]